jgi:hypothetical protein
MKGFINYTLQTKQRKSCPQLPLIGLDLMRGEVIHSIWYHMYKNKYHIKLSS